MVKQKKFILRSFIIAGLRRLTYRFPSRYLVMGAARVERGKYSCNVCKLIVGRSEIRMDHITPVVPFTGFPKTQDGRDDWTVYIERMFVGESGWQALCLTCDKAKMAEERKLRKINKKKC